MQKVEICYTHFTLPQNVTGYVHTSTDPELMYTIQLISVYIKATYNILVFLKESKRGIFLHLHFFKASYHYLSGVKFNFGN